MSKNKNKIVDKTEEGIESDTASATDVTVELAKNKSKENKEKNNKKNTKKKDKKEKNKFSIVRSTRSTVSELKKVTWPTFGEVVKRTGIVLAFVIIFGVIIFGIDTLLGLLVNLLQG